MKLIFISDNGCHHKKINLSKLSFGLILLGMIVFISAILGSFSYNKNQSISSPEIRVLNKFDAMLLKTAKLEGQIKRLNSLGKIIADKNNIDIQAYLLSQVPAMGGLGKSSKRRSSIMTQEDLARSISDLELEMEIQEQRFEILGKQSNAKYSTIKTASNISNDFNSYSNPVSKGYVSSSFGNRRDPFNGHQRHHNGIDIAAKHGSEIHTIASGFVTFSGRKGGYGNVIDIHHSDSLKSRYAHLDSIKVKKGDVVRKGDVIATMGKTGRATGPHLHLEVWKKNKPVNPDSYIDTALIK